VNERTTCTSKVTELSQQQSSRVELQGVLRFASSPLSKKLGTVHLVDAESNQHVIRVPIALMKDIVQPYYEEQVLIVAFRKGTELILDEIERDK
jgi:hypothetical protein